MKENMAKRLEHCVRRAFKTCESRKNKINSRPVVPTVL
jgi:hypothetical protein